VAVGEPATPEGIRWWDRQGLRGGVLAGIGFAMVELVLMDLQGGHLVVARFLRRIAATWLGPQVMEPAFPFTIVAVVGTLIHFGLSALFGLIFTWMTESRLPALERSRAILILAATAYGLLLWPLNVYLIAPFVGWDWFARETEPLVQAAAHLCYGLLLGLSLNHRLGLRPARAA
jgi:hypothetical protein